ncbi:hypothetical protein B0H65DRAFT_415432, partial [Neurospora tetraspora]
TILKTISTSNRTILPFVLLPGVNITYKYINNSLNNRTILAASVRKYINN